MNRLCQRRSSTDPARSVEPFERSGLRTAIGGDLLFPVGRHVRGKYLCHSHAITLALIPMQPHLSFHVQKHGEEERGSVHL